MEKFTSTTLEIYESLCEIYYSDHQKLDDKLVNIRKCLERTYKLLLGLDADTYTSLRDLEQEVTELEAAPMQVRDIMRQLRHRLNPSAHHNTQIYTEDKYRVILLSTLHIISFLTGVAFDKKTKKVLTGLQPKKDPIDNLNNRQRQAVEINDQFVFINAGPGTGKTHLVTHRILKRLESIPNDQYLIALSYTNQAANELKKRVDEMLVVSPYIHKIKQVYSGTIHSFCLDQFTAYFKKTKNELYEVSVIDDEEYKELESMFMDKTEFKKLLSTNRLLNYTGILEFYLDCLKKDKEFLKYTSSRISEIVIDEAQDLGGLYYKIFKELQRANKQLSLFFVGDQRQNIFGFTGGSIENMEILKQGNTNLFNNVNLELSYRCPQKVLSYLNKINFGDCDNPALQNPNNQSEERIILEEFSDKTSEATGIVKQIKSLQEEGNDLKQMVVLQLTAYYFKELAEELNNNNIPFRLVGGKRTMHEDLKVLWMSLRFLHDSDLFMMPRLIRHFKSDFRLGPMKLKGMKGILADTFEEEALVFKYLKGLRKLKKESSIGFQESIDLLVRQLRKLELISEEESKTCQNLNELVKEHNMKEMADLKFNLFGGAKEFEAFMPHGTGLRSEHFEEGKPYVTLSTVHSAKGLEWDFVFIAGLANDIFPAYRQTLAEAQKLFYVAASRSKNRLFFTRPKEQQTQYGTVYRKERSSLLIEDPDNLYILKQNYDVFFE